MQSTSKTFATGLKGICNRCKNCCTARKLWFGVELLNLGFTVHISFKMNWCGCNSECWKFWSNVRKFLGPQLPAPRRMLFHQDRAITQTAVINMDSLRTMFGKHNLSHFTQIRWLPRLPNISAPDFLPWGHKNNLVYQKKKLAQHMNWRKGLLQRFKLLIKT